MNIIKNLEKSLMLITIIVLLGATIFLLVERNQEKNSGVYCRLEGYIPVSEANNLVKVTNNLVNITNTFFEIYGIDKLSYIQPWEDLSTP